MAKLSMGEVYETLIVLSENVQKLKEQQDVLLQRLEMIVALLAQTAPKVNG